MAHQVMAQFEAQNSLDRGIDIGLAEMPRFHPVRKVPDQLRQQARLGRRGDADRHQGNIHPGGKDIFSRRLLAEMLGNRAHIQRI